MTALLADGNVLVALVVNDHLHHDLVVDWFAEEEPDLATCPITEGTLLRFLLREGSSVELAMRVLDGMRAQSWHEFWPDAIPYRSRHLRGVIGHRQVTDAYLVATARERGSQLVTLDRGLHLLHGDDAVLLGS